MREVTVKSLSWWKIWRNPIFRRYCRSRLRGKSLVVMILMALIGSVFLTATFYLFGKEQIKLPEVEAARMPVFPLLIFQGVLLFLLATGQSSGAITQEKDEGVDVYQRLSPLPPLTKVMGYLFGLPVREYVLVLVTMPFTLWCVVKGEVPWATVLQLYGVFWLAAISYHLTGIVTGSVVKNRRWAFLTSIAVVFILYTVLPLLSGVGLVYFQYFTITPVVEVVMPELLPERAVRELKDLRGENDWGKFYGTEMPVWLLTAAIQSIIVLTGVYVLWRRWSRGNAHLISKWWALLLMSSVVFFILGVAQPLIESGRVFPSYRPPGSWRDLELRRWVPEEREALGMTMFFAMLVMVLVWALTLVITSTTMEQKRSWRRVRKLGRKRYGFGSDASSSLPWVIAMGIVGGVALDVFATWLLAGKWFADGSVPPKMMLHYGAAIFLSGLTLQALREGGDGKSRIVIYSIFILLVPLLVAIVFAILGDGWQELALFIAGISPLTWPFYAGIIELEEMQSLSAERGIIQVSLVVWQLLSLLSLVFLWLGLVRSRWAIRKSA